MKRSQTSLFALVAVGGLGFPSLGCAKGQAPPPVDTPASVAAAKPAPAPAAPQESFGSFTIAELEAKMQAAKAGQLKLFIYDNNSPERYAKSHLPGAKWVYYETVTEKDLPKDKDATLVFYCANEH
jgi:septal ring-binding cell division protein DamX